MKNVVAMPGLARDRFRSGTGFAIFFRLLIRAGALSVFVLMSLAEPFVAAIMSILAMGCFLVSVLFGFIFHAPFPHKWFVLGSSIAFMLVYFVYRFLMLGVERLMR